VLQRSQWAILVCMSSRLGFVDSPTTHGIVPVVDEVEFPRLLGRSVDGLARVDAQIAARLLQGWELPAQSPASEPARALAPQPRRGPAGATYRQLFRFGFVAARDYPELRYVMLPGGDEPRIEEGHLDDFRDREGIPVASSPYGLSDESIDVVVVHHRDRVVWSVGELEFTFPQKRYDNAMRELLALVGESPRLVGE
jgi:hypothetical protein